MLAAFGMWIPSISLGVRVGDPIRYKDGPDPFLVLEIEGKYEYRSKIN